MPDPVAKSPSIWQSLDVWARGLKQWQRHILAYAARVRHVDDARINEIYGVFREDMGLDEKSAGGAGAVGAISGRPAEALAQPLRIDGISDLIGINALPDGARLSFGAGLTAIYGRNGAGKSGFARLLANACFSRYKPAIIDNIYKKGARRSASAKISVSIDGKSHELLFDSGAEHSELKRISFFDSAVARHHVSQTAPFEFKPAGFDVFPEMARVYAELGEHLETDIRARTHDTKFSDSFIAPETEVSKLIATLGPTTDLTRIRQLAVYGATERARLEEIDRQLVTLKSRSPKDLLAQMKQARRDIEHLSQNLAAAAERFTPERFERRSRMAGEAKSAAEAATALGIEQFRRPFFKAIGTAEWQAFAKATHALAKKQGADYPMAGERCLLCERPFDADSRKHVEALLSFVEGDLQRTAAVAQSALDQEILELQTLDLRIFDPESRVRDHIRRLDPEIETAVAGAVEMLGSVREKAVAALGPEAAADSAVDVSPVSTLLKNLLTRIDADVIRLEKDDPTEAIKSLEGERQTLRHREVLSQLLPAIQRKLADEAWCAKAERAKASLNPRHITEKEKELFGAVIGGAYRTRLAEECRKLDCVLPVELQTAGQKGKTVRSLAMKGGHQPDMILSEGEQKAVALADFLTEISLNPANAGIILDDPVTSQDHQRKERIAQRLVEEAKVRQVIVFTHDLPFLNQIISRGEADGVDLEAHWIDRDKDGNPGQVTLHDAPATSKVYDTVERARTDLAAAQKLSGSARHSAIVSGMGALRRTLEETVEKRIFRGIVSRWSDRVIVTGLRRVAWDNGLADELVDEYEALSAYIEGHSHTDEASGAPPEIKDLDEKIVVVDRLIKRAKNAERKSQKIGKNHPAPSVPTA